MLFYFPTFYHNNTKTKKISFDKEMEIEIYNRYDNHNQNHNNSNYITISIRLNSNEDSTSVKQNLIIFVFETMESLDGWINCDLENMVTTNNTSDTNLQRRCVHVQANDFYISINSNSLTNYNNDNYKRSIILMDAELLNDHEGTTTQQNLGKLISITFPYLHKQQQQQHYYPTPKYHNHHPHHHHYPTPKGEGEEFEEEEDGELDIDMDMDKKFAKVCLIFIFNADLINKMQTQQYNDINGEINDHKTFAPILTSTVSRSNGFLKTKFEGDKYQIEIVYKWNNLDMYYMENDNEIHTLSPSKNKSGIQLIKFKINNKLTKNISIKLEVTFDDRNGKEYKYVRRISLNLPKDIEKIINDMIENDEDDMNKNSLYLDLFIFIINN